MTNKKWKLNNMLSLVSSKFDGVYDKGGEPYTMHCIRVMQNLHTNDEELMCIGLGHDLIEDTDVTYDYILENFSKRVADGILRLSKTKNEDLSFYKARVLAHIDTILVKEADLKDNSDIKRLKGLREKDFERMKKYHEFWIDIQDKKREMGLLP